jgi:hypothetical protein
VAGIMVLLHDLSHATDEEDRFQGKGKDTS